MSDGARLRRRGRPVVRAAIDTIFFTGGSSRVPVVRAAIVGAAPGARLAMTGQTCSPSHQG